MTDNTNASMNDAELNDVAGGKFDDYYITIYNSKGQAVGNIFTGDGILKYWPCIYCGKPMHQGKLGAMFCDPCDNWLWSYDEKEYSGTEDQLKAESL